MSVLVVLAMAACLLCLCRAQSVTYTTSIAVRGGQPGSIALGANGDLYAALGGLGPVDRIVRFPYVGFNLSRPMGAIVLNGSGAVAGSGIEPYGISLGANGQSLLLMDNNSFTNLDALSLATGAVQVLPFAQLFYLASEAPGPNGGYYIYGLDPSYNSLVQQVSSAGAVVASLNLSLPAFASLQCQRSTATLSATYT